MWLHTQPETFFPQELEGRSMEREHQKARRLCQNMSMVSLWQHKYNSFHIDLLQTFSESPCICPRIHQNYKTTEPIIIQMSVNFTCQSVMEERILST